MAYGRMSGRVQSLPSGRQKGRIKGEVSGTFFNFEPPLTVKATGGRTIRLRVGSRVTFHVNENGEAINVRASLAEGKA